MSVAGASVDREDDMDRGPAPIRRVRFGEVEVDLLERELRRQGLKVRLTERPFQVLCLLLGVPAKSCAEMTFGKGSGRWL